MRMLEQVGDASAAVWNELLGIVGFFGAMIVALGTQIRARRRFRWNAIVTRFQTVGVDALPIIGLMSFLRSEEHTSELQSLMRISYAVLCLKKKNIKPTQSY